MYKNKNINVKIESDVNFCSFIGFIYFNVSDSGKIKSANFIIAENRNANKVYDVEYIEGIDLSDMFTDIISLVLRYNVKHIFTVNSIKDIKDNLKNIKFINRDILLSRLYYCLPDYAWTLFNKTDISLYDLRFILELDRDSNYANTIYKAYKVIYIDGVKADRVKSYLEFKDFIKVYLIECKKHKNVSLKKFKRIFPNLDSSELIKNYAKYNLIKDKLTYELINPYSFYDIKITDEEISEYINKVL